MDTTLDSESQKDLKKGMQSLLDLWRECGKDPLEFSRRLIFQEDRGDNLNEKRDPNE